MKRERRNFINCKNITFCLELRIFYECEYKNERTRLLKPAEDHVQGSNIV